MDSALVDSRRSPLSSSSRGYTLSSFLDFSFTPPPPNMALHAPLTQFLSPGELLPFAPGFSLGRVPQSHISELGLSDFVIQSFTVLSYAST